MVRRSGDRCHFHVDAVLPVGGGLATATEDPTLLSDPVGDQDDILDAAGAALPPGTDVSDDFMSDVEAASLLGQLPEAAEADTQMLERVEQDAERRRRTAPRFVVADPGEAMVLEPNEVIDMEASAEHLGLRPPPWDRTHVPERWMDDKSPAEITMALCAAAGVPVMLWGEPGEGKSATITSLARAMGCPMQPEGGSVVINAAQVDPTEFRGLPMLPPEIFSGRVSWEQAVTQELPHLQSPPEWAAMLAKRCGLFFLDEITNATPAVMGALQSVVQDRRLGSIHFGNRVRVVMAGNPPSDDNDVTELSSAMANRVCHIQWEPPAPAVLGGLRRSIMERRQRALGQTVTSNRQWPTVSELDLTKAALDYAEPLVSAFLESKSSQIRLHRQKAGDALDRTQGYPSPRAWENVISVVATSRAWNMPANSVADAVAGIVGKAAATEFLQYLRSIDLPRPADVLAGRVDLRELGQRVDRKAVVARSLAAYTSDRISQAKSIQEARKARDALFVCLAKNTSALGDDLIAMTMRHLAEAESAAGRRVTELLDGVSPEGRSVLVTLGETLKRLQDK